MNTNLVFTVIATDRPGVVERVADTVAELGGNWIESSMARLGGEFAGIVRIAIDEASVTPLNEKLTALSSEGIQITQRTAPAEEHQPKGTSAQLNVVSQDHPGILRDITHILSEHHVSIENLETVVTAGSMQGGALFKASAELRLPEGMTPTELSDALQEVAADLMADINLAD